MATAATDAEHPHDGFYLGDASTDSVLVERARGGDTAAFREIVERHEAGIAATVIGMLGPGDEADDVGQETFIRFYRSMHHFRGEAVLRTYLTRIAMNLSLNALKGRKRQSVRVRIEDRAVSAMAAATQDTEHRGPEAEVEILETQRAVRAAIDGLEVKHRLVVVLRMIEGLSTKETAKALRVPEGTVLSRLSRAMKKLEADLGAWMDVDD